MSLGCHSAYSSFFLSTCRLAMLIALLTIQSPAWAQDPAVPPADGGGEGQADGGGTIGTGTTSGVAVDANGVLRRLTVGDAAGELKAWRAREALAWSSPCQRRKWA